MKILKVRHQNYLIRALVAALAILSTASKPISERSEERCRELLNNSKSVSVQWFSPSTLIPLNILLGSTKSNVIAKYWLEGDRYSKQFPTSGHVQMFQTANLAANEIIESMDLVTVAPVYDKHNIVDGVRATLDLMRSKSPPKYIRNGMLLRDGVFMVVPILKLSKTKSGKTNYIPIIAKGHQELEKFDILSAAFAAWMLEPWMGAMPDEAIVYLKPMAERRVRKASGEKDKAIYKIKPDEYSLRIHQIYETFMRLVTDSDKLEKLRPYRNIQLGRSPWATYARAEMLGSKDLSMMPFPPTVSQIEVLNGLGYGNMEKLADLDVNSEEFLRVALTTGITPTHLRYYVIHALAFVQDKPLVFEAFEDPFLSTKRIVHIDFEDMINPKVRSGVYLFGIEEQDGKIGSRALQKRFIFSDALDQESIDEAWAKFFRFLKNEPSLKSGDYLITMYSKHELVKIEQELDVLKQSADKFSTAEKNSPFYSEFKVRDKIYGRLIRRTEFFKKYPDIKPAQVFDVIAKMIDLLQYVRWNMAFPTYSNGIKNIQKYVTTSGEELKYQKGSNGLASLAWATEAYETGEPALKEKIRTYNEMDVDMNRVLADYLRRRAGDPTYEKIHWDEKTEMEMKDNREPVQARRAADALGARRRLLEEITGAPLSGLRPKQISQLMAILDRSAYLRKLQSFSDNKELTKDEIEAAKQFEKFMLENERQHELTEFFSAINPKIKRDPDSPAAAKLVELIDASNQFLTPKQIILILALDRMERQIDRSPIGGHGSVTQRLAAAESNLAGLRNVELSDLNHLAAHSNPSIEVGENEYVLLWAGLYLQRLFPAAKKP